MAEIITVAIKEMKLLFRDLSALVMLFLLPAIFILVMSIALQGAFATEERGERLDVLFVDESDGPWSLELSKAIDDSRHFRTLRELDGEVLTEGRAKQVIRSGQFRIGVVVPADVEGALDREGESAVQVIIDPALSRAYVVSVQTIVEGVASARIIGDLVERTRDLAGKAKEAARGAAEAKRGAAEAKRGAEKAKAAVEELKTKIDELASAQRECVDTLQKTAKTAKMLEEKLRSVKAKLTASGFDTSQWEGGGSATPQVGPGPQKKSDKQNEKQDSREAQPRGPSMEGRVRPAQMYDAGIDGDASTLDADLDVHGDASVLDGDVPDDHASEGDGNDDEALGLRVEQVYVAFGGEGQMPNTVQQQVPGWTIFALFWIVQILAVNMIRERLSGAFRRVLVSPLALWKYLVGATVPFFVVNLLQACLMFAIGIYVLPLLGCERLVITDVPALLLVTVCVSLSALSMGLLMASISKTVFFAASASAILIVIMAIMGGIMVPRVIMPASMQQIGYWVPHGWALDGYVDILVRGDTVMGVLDTACALLGFAAAYFAIAVVRFRRLVRVQ